LGSSDQDSHLQRENCATLGEIAQEATKRNLKLIFNTHMKDTVPQGIDGAYFVPSLGPDIFKVSGGNGRGVWRSRYEDVVVRDSYKEPMVLFHKKFAECFQVVLPGRKHTQTSACKHVKRKC
jgi:hypothetical protein